MNPIEECFMILNSTTLTKSYQDFVRYQILKIISYFNVYIFKYYYE